MGSPGIGNSLHRVKRFKRNIDPFFVRKIIQAKGDEHIVLINGAILRFKSAENPDSLYGADVWAAVLDEASRMREEAYYAIRSTLTATRGHIRIIGNVKGRKNCFYQSARRRKAEILSEDYRYQCHRCRRLSARGAGRCSPLCLMPSSASVPVRAIRRRRQRSA